MPETWSIRARALALVVLVAVLPGSASGNRVIRLNTFGGLAGLFNLAQGAVRIVSVVSPTCPSCRSELGDIAAVISEFPTRRLRAYVTFVPQNRNDSVFRALERVKELDDRRVVYFWDADGIAHEAWPDLLTDESPLLHMHALYDTDAQFRDAPAPPSWLHVHGPDGSPPLDRPALTERVREMLDRLEARKRAAAQSEEP